MHLYINHYTTICDRTIDQDVVTIAILNQPRIDFTPQLAPNMLLYTRIVFDDGSAPLSVIIAVISHMI